MSDGPRYLLYTHKRCEASAGRPSLVPRWRVEAGSGKCQWCGEDGPLSNFTWHKADRAFHKEHELTSPAPASTKR